MRLLQGIVGKLTEAVLRLVVGSIQGRVIAFAHHVYEVHAIVHDKWVCTITHSLSSPAAILILDLHHHVQARPRAPQAFLSLVDHQSQGFHFHFTSLKDCVQ